MVTAAKNSTTLKSPHRSALATRNSPTQTHLCRNNSTVRWNRARFYHAELGRFVSRDPIGYVDGMNLYRAYFLPSGVDPTGLSYETCAQTSQRCTSSKTIWIGVWTKITICLQRRCKWRCYCALRVNCYQIPCRDRNCRRDHGVEEAGTWGPDPTKPLGAAPLCRDVIISVLRRGDCPGSPGTNTPGPVIT